MSCSSIMFSLFLMAPCTDGGSASVSEAVANAVSNPDRPAQDIARDADRKPSQVLSFFDIKPGMTVLDMFSGSGYYAEILNSLVGQEGKVIAHSNKAYMSFIGDAFEKRHANGRLGQTETIVNEVNDLEFEDNSLDAALFVLTWHDFLFADPENGWPAIDETRLVNKLCRAIKPGGVVGLVDHVGKSSDEPEQLARKLHRVDPQAVRDVFAGSCFKLNAEAGFLSNPDDDHSLSVFDQEIRGHTDRFVFRFVKN